MEKRTLTRGDACPNCGGPLRAAPVPTDEQRKHAETKEDRTPFPPHFDTMTAAQREEHGALFGCILCPYKTRFPLEAAAASL